MPLENTTRPANATTKVAAAENQTLRWCLLALVCVLSFSLLALRLKEGFHGGDDGALAHEAERVLHGERPFITFHEIYTGGLTYLHVLAFRMFGTRILSLRIMLAIFFALWVPTFWYVACRLTSVGTAFLITLLASAWSVPIYASPFGWYSLFFATFGTAVMMRYIEKRTPLWLFAAGLCSGLSFLVKVTGLYFALAGIIFLIYDDQNKDTVQASAEPHRSSAWSILLTAGLVLLDLCLVMLVHSKGTAASYYHFVLPTTMLSALLMAREWHAARPSFFPRLRRFASSAVVFFAGFILPVALFLIPYARTKTLGLWFNGVFVLPTARIHSVSYPAISPLAAIFCIPLFVLLLLDGRLKHDRYRRWALYFVTSVLLLTLYFSLQSGTVALWVWVSAATAIPVATGVGVLLLWRKVTLAAAASCRLMLVVTVAATCSLSQFPFSHPMYFCFVAPLGILALTALASNVVQPRALSVLIPIPIFYLMFVLLVIMPSQLYDKQLSFEPQREQAFVLARNRGIVGDASEVTAYEGTVREILRHAGNTPIFAGPDAPELYFLTGKQNPTPNIFECVSGADAEPQSILARIDRAGVNAVAINHSTHTPSAPAPEELLLGLRGRFPKSRVIGRFEIRWRDAIGEE